MYTIKELLTYINDNNIPLNTPIGIHIRAKTLLQVIEESDLSINTKYYPLKDKYADVVLPVYHGEGNPMLFITTDWKEE